MNENLLEKDPGVPEKFRDPETGDIRTDALLGSYLELEKKLSKMIPLPETDEDRTKLYRVLGVPETPDEYHIELAHGLFEADPELNARLHQAGFTPSQVQLVYDLAAERLVPLIVEMAGEFQADREVERLVAEFGGAEQWREVSRQLLAFGRKNLQADVLEGLSSSYEGVMALYRMMKGEEPEIGKEAKSETSTDEKELQAMMRDPKYWKQKDPAVIAKVTQGFEKLYGGVR